MSIGPYMDPHDLALYPKADQVMFPVLMIEGVPAQTFEGGVLFEFELGEDGEATSFEARLEQADQLWMTGTRID